MTITMTADAAAVVVQARRGLPGRKGLSGPRAIPDRRDLPGLKGRKGLPGPRDPRDPRVTPGLRGRKGLPGRRGRKGLPDRRGPRVSRAVRPPTKTPCCTTRLRRRFKPGRR